MNVERRACVRSEEIEIVHIEEGKKRKRERNSEILKTLRARILCLQIHFPLALAFASECLHSTVLVNHGGLTISLQLLSYQQPISQNICIKKCTNKVKQ